MVNPPPVDSSIVPRVESARGTEGPIAMSAAATHIIWMIDQSRGESSRITKRFEKQGDDSMCLSKCNNWRCTLKKGHSGTHLGGTGAGYYGAEWSDFDPVLGTPEGL